MSKPGESELSLVDHRFFLKDKKLVLNPSYRNILNDWNIKIEHCNNRTRCLLILMKKNQRNIQWFHSPWGRWWHSFACGYTWLH